MNYIVLTKDGYIWYEGISMEDAENNCPWNCYVRCVSDEELDRILDAKDNNSVDIYTLQDLKNECDLNSFESQSAE